MQIKYTFNMSRVLKHIEENTFGVISAYLGRLSLAENKVRQRQLKELVRSKGYGYKEIKGLWQSEKSEKLEEEYALFIPKVSFEDIISFGKKFEQEAILYGNPNAGDDGEIILYDTKAGTIKHTFNGIHTNPNASWDLFSKIKNKSFKFSSVVWYMGDAPEKNSFITAMLSEAWKDFSKCCDLSEEEERILDLTCELPLPKGRGFWFQRQ